MRAILTAIFTCLFASAAIAQTPADAWRGAWTGSGIQDGATWEMSVYFADSGAAVEYPGLRCGGYWIYDHYQDPSRSIEKIHHGLDACLDDLIVRVSEATSGALTVDWFLPNGDLIASGTLTRPKRSR
ncbi:MAG: hypothetical protein AAGP08_02950 [Pseudomonadota bacterium]